MARTPVVKSCILEWLVRAVGRRGGRRDLLAYADAAQALFKPPGTGGRAANSRSLAGSRLAC